MGRSSWEGQQSSEQSCTRVILPPEKAREVQGGERGPVSGVSRGRGQELALRFVMEGRVLLAEAQGRSGRGR